LQNSNRSYHLLLFQVTAVFYGTGNFLYETLNQYLYSPSETEANKRMSNYRVIQG